MVPPGQHQTFRGPLFVPFPPVVPIVRTAEQKARGRRRWWVGSGLAVAIVGVLAVAAALSPGDGSSPAGTMSAGACLNVVSAARDLSAGSRTLPSFLAVVRAQEGPAREASRMNSRYLPISQAIVSVDEDVSAGQSGAVGMAVLFRECGS